jgi:hypothetical protein
MNAIVIEHVSVDELPDAWRARLSAASGATVTVRIEADESLSRSVAPSVADDPLFGMWRDREDMADVASYIRNIRADRFNETPRDKR